MLPLFLLMSKLAKYLGTIKLKHQPITTKQAGCNSADQGGGKWRGEEGTLNSFVETEHDLDGIHEGRFAVLIAI